MTDEQTIDKCVFSVPVDLYSNGKYCALTSNNYEVRTRDGTRIYSLKTGYIKRCDQTKCPTWQTYLLQTKMYDMIKSQQK